MSHEFRILIETDRSNKHPQAGTYSIRVIESPAGTTRPAMLSLNVKDREFKDELRIVQGLAPGKMALAAFGERLFNAIFTGEVLNRWNRSRKIAKDDKAGLSLRLLIEPDELAELPWELLWDPKHQDHPANAAGLGISRGLTTDEWGAPPAPTQAVIRVLVVIESPEKLPRIAEAEVSLLTQAIKKLGNHVEPIGTPGPVRLILTVAALVSGPVLTMVGVVLAAAGVAVWLHGKSLGYDMLLRSGAAAFVSGLGLLLFILVVWWFARLKVVVPNVLRNVTATDLETELAENHYDVLHYIGHARDGRLCLVSDKPDKIDFLDGKALTQLIPAEHNLRLVVLSACNSANSELTNVFSAVGPALFKAGVPSVVAMQ